MDLNKYQFYIHNNRVHKIEELQKLAYLISADNYQIERWTIAEYICIQSSRWLMLKRNEREMRIKAEECLEKLEVSIDVSRQLKSLSEYEKRIIDIVKAYNLGAHLLIIEDEMTGMRHEDMERFRFISHVS